LGFFGLRPKDKPLIHDSIFSLVYHGNGFNFSDVYEMPVYLRNFYIKKLIDTKKEEQKQIEKSQSKIKKPNFRK
jgi:hypothetical protein|tara:strand:+ start:49 stop:270 length:222 start_codon:yes stop_codon:yes gene_type:complete